MERTITQRTGIMVGIGILAALLGLRAPAYAALTASATLQGTAVKVQGSGVTPGHSVYWDGLWGGFASATGTFSFFSVDVPAECIGDVTADGAKVAVAVQGCSPQCPPRLQTCTTNLNTCTTDKATLQTQLTQTQTSLSTCTTDKATLQTQLTQTQTSLSTCTTSLGTCQTDLAACHMAASQTCPATGQTMCWDSSGGGIACAGTGQDGDIRAGGALSYTDNGNGTITDNNTGLMWEKQSDDGTIHDKDNIYTWAEAFAVHIAGLNAGAGFAGHTDWRLPNYKELVSILNLQNAEPAVSAAFNNSCTANCTVLTCSCTAANFYWSSTSSADNPSGAWDVDFFGGNVFAFDKLGTFRVRAVRGGR